MSDNVRRDNRRALPKYLLTILLFGLLGGVLGFFTGVAGAAGVAETVRQALDRVLAVCAPWGIVGSAVVLLGAGWYLYAAAKRRFAAWDGEDEDAMDTELETLNSMIPIWKKQKSEVTDEEYNSFYKDKFGDYADPARVIVSRTEGTANYNALLFVPSHRPYDFYTKDYEKGLALYASGVLIMEKCADLLPDYFSFVKGIVDSQDLSLNISREMLQKDNQLKLIHNALEKKIKNELHAMLANDREKYESFWKEFGRQLKFGAYSDYGMHAELLRDLLLFWSAKEQKMVTLQEYVDKMPSEQKYIYFAAGESIEAIDHMPQTEMLKDSSTEILYFTDKTDEFIADMFRTYQEKEFRSALDDEPETTGEEKKEPDEAAQPALDLIRETLGAKVDGVKASTRLKTHPVCLTCGEGLTFEMEKYFTAVQPDLGLKAKRILEVNTNHPAFAALESARETDPEKAKKYAEILYQQACLIAGLPIENPSDYTDLLCSLW